jgi:G:T-mismatch repair DNA endonuclease (very short patch repair protein)
VPAELLRALFGNVTKPPGCQLASRPKTRGDHWAPKLAANVARDARHAAELKSLGWLVETVWECETRDSKRLEQIAEEISRMLR